MCTAQYREALKVHTQCLSRLCSTYTHSTVQYTHTHHGQISCRNTDYVPINGLGRAITVILAKHCIEFPDDGSLVIQNMLGELQYFKYFIIILIVSTNNMFVHLLDDIVF